MKIIRHTVFAVALATLTTGTVLSAADEALSSREIEALELAIDMIEGGESSNGKNINAVCSDLVALLNESSKWPELKALLCEYATLDVKSLKFFQRPGKVKEIIDRLIDLKNRGKLPGDLVQAVDRVNKALLLKRLTAMLSA